MSGSGQVHPEDRTLWARLKAIQPFHLANQAISRSYGASHSDRALCLGEDGQAASFEDLLEIGDHLSQQNVGQVRLAGHGQSVRINLFSSRIGDQISGVINGVAKFGLFITLEGLGAEGLVPVRELPDDRYQVDEKRRRLIGRRNGLVFQIGKPLEVIVRINPLSGSLTLALASVPEQTRGGNQRKKRG